MRDHNYKKKTFLLSNVGSGEEKRKDILMATQNGGQSASFLLLEHRPIEPKAKAFVCYRVQTNL